MSPIDLLDDIIQSIDPDEVPLEYIIMANVTDFRGNQRILKGAEIARVMRGPERKTLAEARVILDVRKIRNSITAGVNEIYDEINRLCDEEDHDEAHSEPDEPKDTDI